MGTRRASVKGKKRAITKLKQEVANQDLIIKTLTIEVKDLKSAAEITKEVRTPPPPPPPPTIPTPTLRPSIIGRSVEDAADFFLAVKKWDPDLAFHMHKNGKGKKSKCRKLGCDWKFWHHPEVARAMAEYPDLEDWVDRDPEKFNSLLLMGTRKDRRAVDGRMVTIFGIRIQLKKLIQIIIGVLGVSGLSAILTSTMLTVWFGGF